MLINRRTLITGAPAASFAYPGNAFGPEALRAIALRDLAAHTDPGNPPPDPLRGKRHPKPKQGKLLLPVEMEATRSDPDYWLANMLHHHRYSVAEAALRA